MSTITTIRIGRRMPDANSWGSIMHEGFIVEIREREADKQIGKRVAYLIDKPFSILQAKLVMTLLSGHDNTWFKTVAKCELEEFVMWLDYIEVTKQIGSVSHELCINGLTPIRNRIDTSGLGDGNIERIACQYMDIIYSTFAEYATFLDGVIPQSPEYTIRAGSKTYQVKGGR